MWFLGKAVQFCQLQLVSQILLAVPFESHNDAPVLDGVKHDPVRGLVLFVRPGIEQRLLIFFRPVGPLLGRYHRVQSLFLPGLPWFGHIDWRTGTGAWDCVVLCSSDRETGDL